MEVVVVKPTSQLLYTHTMLTHAHTICPLVVVVISWKRNST